MQHNCPMEKVCSSSFKSSHEKDEHCLYLSSQQEKKKESNFTKIETHFIHV